MPKKIYNKNAREKALLEEAYSSVYNEQLNQEVMVGAEVMWDGQRKRGQVEEVDVENGVAVVYDDGGEHIVELDNFDVVINPETDVISGDVPPPPPAQPGDPHYGLEDEEDTDVADQRKFAEIDPLEDAKARLQGFNPKENEEGGLSDDWEKPNYRGDQHDFQPGEIVEVGPWGPDDEADHLEVVLQIKGDVVNTIPITDDAYGVQYGGRGGADIELIRPQSESSFDDSDFKPADGREW